MNKKTRYLLVIIFSISSSISAIDMYFCTAADKKYFKHLINLLGSIHATNFEDTIQIAVFDLGLTPEQRNIVQHIQKVQLYDVERTHPDIIKIVEHSPGRKGPGYYAWKAVILKQCLSDLQFPYVLYIDSGTTILGSLDNLFKHIVQNGYFFTDCGHNVKWMTTKHAIKLFNLESEENAWILDENTQGLSANLQGLTPQVYYNYVLPMYELSKDLRHFMDDGTTPSGYGSGRHDQTLFSIMAHLNHFTLQRQDHGDGTVVDLTVDGKSVPLHTTWNYNQVNDNTIIYHSRGRMPQFNHFKDSIRFKNGAVKS